MAGGGLSVDGPSFTQTLVERGPELTALTAMLVYLLWRGRGRF